MTTLEHRLVDDRTSKKGAVDAARNQIALAAEELLEELNDLDAGGVLVAQNTNGDAHVILELSVAGAHELARTLRRLS